jgi:hypothetical protein
MLCYPLEGLGRRRSFGTKIYRIFVVNEAGTRAMQPCSLAPVLALLRRGLAQPFVGAAVILMTVNSWRQWTAGERRMAARLSETEEGIFQFDFQFVDMI